MLKFRLNKSSLSLLKHYKAKYFNIHYKIEEPDEGKRIKSKQRMCINESAGLFSSRPSEILYSKEAGKYLAVSLLL